MRGIVGALIGAVLGGILVLVISQLGYVTWFGGVAMGFLVMGGYKLLAGRVKITGIIIAAIIMLVSMYLINRLDWALEVQKNLTPDMFGMEGTKLSLGFAFANVLEIVEISDLQGEYFQTLAMQMFFTFVFGMLSAFGVMQMDKTSFMAYPIGTEAQDVEDAGLSYADHFETQNNENNLSD